MTPTEQELKEYEEFHKAARYWPKRYSIPSLKEWLEIRRQIAALSPSKA